jgi:methyl halide transferase
MTDLNAKYWNNRYKNNDSGWDVGTITTPIKVYIDQIKNKKKAILIPGAGNSHEAEYLIKNGFTNVFVCDYAPEPVKNLIQRVPDFPGKNIIMADFFELADVQFDLILEQTFFCAIKPELRKRYFAQMHRLLKPKGRLVGLLFDCTFEKEGPPYSGSKEEYSTYFSDKFLVNTYEPCYNSIDSRAGRELFINLQKTG